MTVYVDKLVKTVSRDPVARRVGARSNHRWCHMWADTPEELHKMARDIGMKRSWYQAHWILPHYDLTPGRRAAALRLGAIEDSSADIIRHRLRERRK